jgi:RNA polymerase sigma-54 factor
MFQVHYQSIRHVTTAHLAQTMTLLSLTSDELRQQIESELSNNPALELVDDRRCPNCHRPLVQPGPCPICSAPSNLVDESPIVFVSPREDFYTSGGQTEKEDAGDDNYSEEAEDLPSYVLRQIAPELVPDDRKLAAYILTHLDDEGFLSTTAIEVARYFHIPVDRVEKVLNIIQRADPIGVGTASPKEALLIQLDVLRESRPVPELAELIIKDGLDQLSKRQYAELAGRFSASVGQIRQIARFISDNLNPFPARSHWGEIRQTPKSKGQVYYQPDILISRMNHTENKQLVVEIIMPIHGTLRVNPLFRQAVIQSLDGQKEALKQDLEKALLFVKCLQQRNHTMERLMSLLVTLQKEFILFGEKHLKPITRARIARDLDVHESTVSRAVSNKAIQLPNGKIIPLSEFFDRSLSIRTELREIISKESHPLSDSELVELLAQKGYLVARRTVAKYRAIEGILPANLRSDA